MTKLIDTFLFFNEIEMLHIRLEYLGPVVDSFVIVEADCDFSGEKKDFLLNEDIIKTLPFSEKIIYHRVYVNFKESYWLWERLKLILKPRRKFLWKIQDFQRDQILVPLGKFAEDTQIIFSDIDEIPNKESIKYVKLMLNKAPAVSLIQDFFYYNLDSGNLNEVWYGSIVCTLKVLRDNLPHKMRKNKYDNPYLLHAGWHFSYFMSVEKVLMKVNAIADAEKFSRFKDLDEGDVAKIIEGKLDLYNRDIIYGKDLKKFVSSEMYDLVHKYLPNCVLEKQHED